MRKDRETYVLLNKRSKKGEQNQINTYTTSINSTLPPKRERPIGLDALLPPVNHLFTSLKQPKHEYFQGEEATTLNQFSKPKKPGNNPNIISGTNTFYFAPKPPKSRLK